MNIIQLRGECTLLKLLYTLTWAYEQSVCEYSLIRGAQTNVFFSVYEPPFAYKSSFLSPADRTYRHLFSAVFHFPNFLECTGRHGIAGRSAQKQQRLSVFQCSFIFVVKSAFPLLVTMHRLNHLEFSCIVYNDVGM